MSRLDWQPSDRRPSRPKRKDKNDRRKRTDERVRSLDARALPGGWILTVPIAAVFVGFFLFLSRSDYPTHVGWMFAGAGLGLYIPMIRAAWITFRWLRSGRPVLHLPESPIAPGSGMRGLLRFHRGFAPRDELRLRLLCSRETARTERDQRGRSWHAYSRQDGLVIEETALADREVPVRIAIPEDAPATGDKGVYWELVVEGAGVNAAFPVIVY